MKDVAPSPCSGGGAPSVQLRVGQRRAVFHHFQVAESQNLAIVGGYRPHPVRFGMAAVGIAIASGLACRKPRDSFMFSKVPVGR